jgi:hypothetical protein
MKVLVCGGRDFQDWRVVDAALDKIHAETPITYLIHGGAKGADDLGGAWARRHSEVQEVVCPANWKMLGKAAGPVRNVLMAALRPDLVVAFPGGKGTANMIQVAEDMNLKVARAAPLNGAALEKP